MFWALGLAALSIVLSLVEHGWTTLSRTRLVEGGNGPASRARMQRLIDRGDDAEAALLLLRVGVQVALLACVVQVVHQADDDATLTGTLLVSSLIVFGWITLFCRILPDEVGAGTLERMLRLTMPAVVMVSTVLAPPVQIIRRALRRVTGHTAEAEKELYADEILSAVEESEREGHLEGDQADMIEHVLELSDTEVHELMTPRTDLDVIDIGATVEEARIVATKTGRSRYPLVDGNVDSVVGVVHVKDLLAHSGEEPVRASARPAWFVPESKLCTELLTEFQKHKSHIAVVLDEYGGTAGIITIEDVLEEIVGEIDDEFDDDEEEELRIIDPLHAIAQGTMHIDEVNEALGISLPESDDWSTLGGFIFSTLGRLPEVGEVLKHENVNLEVRRVIERRVDLIAIEILEPVI
jgi:CBS domain containing-hemolysin-like protein